MRLNVIGKVKNNSGELWASVCFKAFICRKLDLGSGWISRSRKIRTISVLAIGAFRVETGTTENVLGR